MNKILCSYAKHTTPSDSSIERSLPIRQFLLYLTRNKGGGRIIWKYSVFAKFLDGSSVILIKMIGISYFSHLTLNATSDKNTTVTVFMQNLITVLR